MSDKIQEKKQAVVRDGMKEDGTSQMSEIEKMGDLFHQIVEDCKVRSSMKSVMFFLLFSVV